MLPIDLTQGCFAMRKLSLAWFGFLLAVLIVFVVEIRWLSSETRTTVQPISMSSETIAAQPNSIRCCSDSRPCNRSAQTKPFVSVQKSGYLDDVYVTLWLHQVHRWFKTEGQDGWDYRRIRVFLNEAKEAGFTSVMGDLPWEWTEREGPGDIRLDSWAKDWMAIACDLGLKLIVVISCKSAPPWLEKYATEDYYQSGRAMDRETRPTGMVSTAHPEVWTLVQNFTMGASRRLVERYGSCLQSISPTLNNEFETRYSQTEDAMRDYSLPSRKLFELWQRERSHTAVEPPVFPRGPRCTPVLEEPALDWLGFREEFLATQYARLCEIVHASGLVRNASKASPTCLLHFGEMFHTFDGINSNVFFILANSTFVDEVVMDSNMAISGSPSSPSIVGIIVSTARLYGKVVHYEAATERILPCSDGGVPTQSTNIDWNKGSGLLMRTGIGYALDAGVNSIGITNLCDLSVASSLFALLRADGSRRVTTAAEFKPSALIFVPYRAFYAWAVVVSGVTCNIKATPCWHTSFGDIPTFGWATRGKPSNSCPTDVAQNSLVHVWDDLRRRHAQVAIVGDCNYLTDDILKQSLERVILTFPGVTDTGKWQFYRGTEAATLFAAKTEGYAFSCHLADALPSGNLPSMR